MKKILVIGGSGYIGSVLVQDLLNEGYQVTNLDLTIFPDQEKKKIKLKAENFLKIDLRNTLLLNQQLNLCDQVIILGGLVGEYITNKYQDLSNSINEIGITKLIDSCENYKNIKNIVFISTCSNYGITKDKIFVDEDYELKPLSLYAKAKVKVEQHLLEKKNTYYAPTILRFATAFGVSDRMRFDLTVNHFCYAMLKHKKIEVYDADTWRPYCHVKDFSRLIIKILNSDRKKISYKVFNAGSNINNFTKENIVELISKKIPDVKVILKKGGADKRDYRVSFDRVEKDLGFKANFSVQSGIDEIIKLLKDNKNKYLEEDALALRGNFNILEHVK
jgi:nucleoside-diphosphate-sugar epimerase